MLNEMLTHATRGRTCPNRVQPEKFVKFEIAASAPLLEPGRWRRRF